MQPSGGIERVVSTLADKLSETFQITILVKDEPSSFYPLNDSVEIKTIHNPLNFDMSSRFVRITQVIRTIWSTSALLEKYFEHNEYDYYYLTTPINVLEFRLANVDPKKIVISEHAAKGHINFVYRSIKKLLYTRCHKYVIPTKTDAKLYIDENYPAVHIPHFRSELPYKTGSKQNKIVLNIGRFTADKQQLMLLRMWHKITAGDKFPGWVLHIAGSGELEHELIDFIRVNMLEDRVVLMPPTVKIEDYYLNASVFTLTSVSEGYGMVLLEAISFGLPCVSFDCPSGPRDILMNGYNGYLVSLNDEQQYMLRLQELMNSQTLINQMGTNAFLSSSNWSDRIILEMWLNVFN
jgi:glycosyltransferase involved in cell wall biosynthesis